MTLSTKIEVFYGFYICSQWAFIHALLSRVPFALAGLSCCCCWRLCAANQAALSAREAGKHQTATDDVLCKLQSTLRAVEADSKQVPFYLVADSNSTAVHLHW